MNDVKLDEVLDLIDAYFDNRADADQEPGDSYPQPNEEMSLLTQLRRERARAAPALSTAPQSQSGEADGWIEWKGGKCPFKSDIPYIEVRLRGDEQRPIAIASAFRWDHSDPSDRAAYPYDIVAYRIRSALEAK